MKAVMISIRPVWCEKILKLVKPWEIRKTFPKLKPPFKCYIYCTNPTDPFKISEHMVAFANCLFRNKKTGEVKLGDSFTGYDLGLYDDPESIECLNGMVIAEFTCNMAMPEDVGHWDTQDGLDVYFPGSCLTVQQYNDYCKGHRAYGWHIADLKAYDMPKELSSFTGLKQTRFGGMPYKLQRPPQSWCYVEELE